MTLLDEAREAVYQRFVDNWTATPFLFENEDSDDLDGGTVAWARLSVRETAGGQETLGPIGARKYRRRASAFVQVFTPVNAGMKAAGVLSAVARAIFEGTSFGGLDFNDARVSDTGPDDKWQQTLVEAVFDFTETK